MPHPTRILTIVVLCTLTFPAAIRAQSDPDLEPGFPVQTVHTAGSYHAGPAIHTLVGNINGDLNREILVSGLATGTLYAWNSSGSTVPGWPVTTGGMAVYPALG